LINPPEAERCDCGFDFASGTTKQSYISPKERIHSQKTAANKLVTVGMLILAVGAGITIFTYIEAAQSSGEGHYVIAYGAIIGGASMVIRGWAAAKGR
jgi:hypothetical protein